MVLACDRSDVLKYFVPQTKNQAFLRKKTGFNGLSTILHRILVKASQQAASILEQTCLRSASGSLVDRSCLLVLC